MADTYRNKIVTAYNSFRLYPPYQTINDEVNGVIYQRWSTNDEEETLISKIVMDEDVVITYTQTFAFDLWENRESADYIYLIQN